MSKTTRFLTSLAITIGITINSLYATDIKELLDRLKGYDALEITFETGDVLYTINSSGNKYTLKSGTIDILYDGDDIYTYNKENNELTIETLSSDNIMTNPTLIFNLDKEQFDFSTEGNIHTITPNDSEKIGIKKIVIESEKSQIKSITISPLDSEEIALSIKSIAEGKSEDKDFKFNKKAYSQAEIIDFR